MKLYHSNEEPRIYVNLHNAELNAMNLVEELRDAIQIARPVMAVAIMDTISQAEQLRQRLAMLAEAARAEAKQ